jgi:hypothetical protein
MSTRSEPHWQNRRTGTAQCSGVANKRQNMSGTGWFGRSVVVYAARSKRHRDGCGSGSRIENAPARSRVATLRRDGTSCSGCDVRILVVFGEGIIASGRSFDAAWLLARSRRKRLPRTFSRVVRSRRPPWRRNAASMERARTASDLDGGHAVPAPSGLARTQRSRRRRTHRCSGLLITAMRTVRAPGHASICRRA